MKVLVSDGKKVEFVTSFSPFSVLSCRSTRLRAVRSTKRESSSSSWLTWSRTTDGSDAPAALPLFLTLECSLSNCVERQPLTTAAPSQPSHTPSLLRRNTPRVLYVHTHTHTPAHRENEQNEWRRGRGATVDGARHRSPPQLQSFWVWPPPPTPPYHAYTWLWWYGDRCVRGARLHWDDTRWFLSFAARARRTTFMTLVILMLFTIVLTSGFGF